MKENKDEAKETQIDGVNVDYKKAEAVHDRLIKLKGIEQVKIMNEFYKKMSENMRSLKPEEMKPLNEFCEEELKGKCKWEQDFEGNWQTSCDNMFVLNDGTPEENEMKYCCYCGKKLEQVYFVEEI